MGAVTNGPSAVLDTQKNSETMEGQIAQQQILYANLDLIWM